jgi:cytochrome c-type biogenesis protein CcmH/NrfG
MPTQLDEARQKTGKVQQDLEVAGAEIGLAKEALDRHLPPEVKEGDVAWAIGQNAAVEQKLEEAVEELEQVTELLAEESAERERLEKRLAAGSGGAV